MHVYTCYAIVATMFVFAYVFSITLLSVFEPICLCHSSTLRSRAPWANGIVTFDICYIIREFKKLRRRRRGKRRLKNDFIFNLLISRFSEVICFAHHCQNFPEPASRTQR